jgi:two-component system chemotaxis sensor kinase CheA
MQDEEFLRTLRATFQVEASEHLQSIAGGLKNLEAGDAPASQQPVVESVFRAAHSLKGAARAVNMPEIEALCQSLESLFAAWKRHESQPTGPSLNTARRALEQMSLALEIPAPADPSPLPSAPQAASSPGRHETVRIQVSALDQRLLEAEEMLSAKLAADQCAVELGALAPGFDQWRKQWARLEARTDVLRRAAPALPGNQELHEVADFLDWNQDYVKALESKLMALQRTAEQDRLLVGRLVDDLLENSKKLLMLPLATLAGLLNKVVRDLARDQGKDVELVLRGEDIAIDKRILEELKDPLIHLLRNCVDHGIETPDERRRAGKSPKARIVVAAIPVNGNQIELSVSDDGGGIAVDKVRAAARSQGLSTPEVADDGDEAAALALTLETGISTSPVVTDLSGRGLGLAIVRENTEKLGGRVQVESRRHSGTTIRMTLPMTLATARGVLVRCAQRQFVIPTAQVERVTRFESDEIRTVEGRRTLTLGDGRTLALTVLAEVLELSAASDEPRAATALTEAVVLNAGEQRIAFAVDAVVDEREVLAKTLPRPLSRVRNISGATVLRSGEVVPILNVWDLMKSARHSGAAPNAPQPAEIIKAETRRVLVVEDSITSRMLLKGILESAGYSVRTAVDGIDGFTAARSEHFDLIVSDVEMPRMNGFDLTARVRADRSLANVPVVLVTALESRADRERGIDVGANAYLVKSSLDQGNFLETLRRLA